MIFSQENIVDPFPSLAKQRENAPVSWHDDLKAWVVLDYRDISSALKNPSFSSNHVTQGAFFDDVKTALKTDYINRLILKLGGFDIYDI